MNCCLVPKIKDLTQAIGPERHLFCANCKAHLWHGKQYTANEWYEWINSEGGQDER